MESHRFMDTLLEMPPPTSLYHNVVTKFAFLFLISRRAYLCFLLYFPLAIYYSLRIVHSFLLSYSGYISNIAPNVSPNNNGKPAHSHVGKPLTLKW